MSVTKEELDRYNAAYMQGNPMISDDEYDRLQEEYVNEHGEESRLYTRSIQTGAVSDLVNTLPKTYGVIETMRPEQKSYKSWVESNGFDTNTKIIVQPKFDGCSIAFDSKEKRFFKRGDYDNGESEEVTNIFDKHQFLDRSRVEEMCDGCKFEMIMGDAVYQEGYKNYETPRDAAVSYMRRCQSDTEYDSQNSFFILTLIPLRELVDGKQYVANIFGEYSFCESIAPYEEGGKPRHTDYDALKECFKKLHSWMISKGFVTCGLPYKIGCGLAGGDWDGVVYPMIKEEFGDDEDITLYIVKYNG